jgi:CxxC-x17-CxxC domain-containing protein
MKDFKKSGRGASRHGSFGGRPSFGRGSRPERSNRDFDRDTQEMFSATCAQCGKRCEVPFRPTGERPVFCRDCFRAQEHVPGRNSNGQDTPGARPRFGGHTEVRNEREFRPHPTKTYSPDGLDSLKRQIIALESKIDRILQIVIKRSGAVSSVTESQTPSTTPAEPKLPKRRASAEKPIKKRVKK